MKYFKKDTDWTDRCTGSISIWADKVIQRELESVVRNRVDGPEDFLIMSGRNVEQIIAKHCRGNYQR